MTWGITIGRNAQRITAMAMAGVGVVLFFIALSSMNGFLKEPTPEHPTGAPEAALVMAAPTTAP
jgi:ABC-type lipoprotein release transport system permease subunit